MDAINALFEFGGCIALIPSIMAILRDKRVHGFSILTPIFFTSWGWWNIIYYPHLDQFYSAVAAAFLAITNTAYLTLVFKYRRQDEQ